MRKPLATTHRGGGFMVLRTPLLPREAFLEWSADLEAASCGLEGACLEAAIERDRARLRARLQVWVGRAEVAEALFVASPSLYGKIAEWLAHPASERSRSVERALVRFFARMATRPTPFGLFAGCTVVKPGRETSLMLGSLAGYRRAARVELDYVTTLTESLARDRLLRRALRFEPNSSIYRAGGRLRYAEKRAGSRGPNYSLVAVDASEYLDTALERARPGATPDEIVSSIASAHPDVDRGEACEFVDELIDGQVLVAVLAPTLTSPSPAGDLERALAGHPAAAAVSDRLSQVARELSALNALPLGVHVSSYQRIAGALGEASPGPREPGGELGVHVDLVKAAPNATFDRPLVELALAAAQLVHRLSPIDEDPLAQFRERFVERYDRREIPLVEALDDELGVGFSVSDSDAPPRFERVGLPFVNADSASNARWGARDAHLLVRLCEALARGADEIVLDEQDLDILDQRPRPLPDSFSVQASLIRVPGRDGEAPKIFVQRVSTPSCARSFARFCHADAELSAHVVRLAKEEQALCPDAIIAEVVHLPGGRVNNVAGRPDSGSYEIPYLCRSAAPPERQIGLEDVLVSVAAGRIFLRSKRLGKEILPRLPSAHVSDLLINLPVYRFLGMVAAQGRANMPRWDWGALAGAPFLPRVVTGRQVLSLRTWRLGPADLGLLAPVDSASPFGAVQRLRERLRWPRRVSLVEGDRVLSIDLDNVLSIEAAVHVMRQRASVVVTEMLEHDDLVQGPGGTFAHELVFPFVAVDRKAQPTRGGSVTGAPYADLVRSFPPGSDWLYAKIYVGKPTADLLLRDHLAPAVQRWLASGATDSWFFVRYDDPESHVRLRCHGDPQRLSTEVLPELHQALAGLFAKRLVWRIQLDTYEREVERYGGPLGISLLEELFRIDSDIAIALLENLRETDPDDRWRVAFSSIDALLADFRLNLSERRAVLGASGAEVQRPPAALSFVREVGAIYRQERGRLEQLLLSPAGKLSEPLALLRERSRRLRPTVAKLLALIERGALSCSASQLAAQLVHMTLNRLLATGHRRTEPALFALLDRCYESRQARA